MRLSTLKRRNPIEKLCIAFVLMVLISIMNCSAKLNKSEKPRSVYHISLENRSIDEQMLVKSIQGLINREIKNGNKSLPMVYTFCRKSDYLWFEDYKNHYSLEPHLEDVKSLYEFASNHIKNYVLWDPQKPWTLTVACSYAAQQKALIFTPQLARNFAADKKLKLVMDFTKSIWYYPELGSTSSQHISNKSDGYAWAIEHVLPTSNMTELIYLRDDIPDLKDYIFFNTIFALNLDPLNNSGEISLLRTILSKFPTETPVLGWADAMYATKPGQDNVTVEHALVTLLSQANDFLIAADYANNLSFHGLFAPPSELKQKEPDGIYVKGKKYVCFIVSDGDNLQYDFNRMRSDLWTTPSRGKFPLGWTLAPTLVKYAPFIAWYYYHSAALSNFNDTFVAGPSGYAYVHPSSLDKASLLRFLELTKESMGAMDMSCLVSIDSRGREGKTYQEFAENTSVTGIFMVESDHANYPPYHDHVFVAGSHNMGYIVESIRVNKQSVQQLASEIKMATNKHPFVMLYVNAWENNLETVYQTIKSLQSGGDYYVLGPHEFMDCLIQYGKE